MLESELIKSTSSWPFVEIRKLLKDRDSIIKKKNKIIFQTGYGPSGLPHIGTFGEVSRTSMIGLHFQLNLYHTFQNQHREHAIS